MTGEGGDTALGLDAGDVDIADELRFGLLRCVDSKVLFLCPLSGRRFVLVRLSVSSDQGSSVLLASFADFLHVSEFIAVLALNGLGSIPVGPDFRNGAFLFLARIGLMAWSSSSSRSLVSVALTEAESS